MAGPQDDISVHMKIGTPGLLLPTGAEPNAFVDVTEFVQSIDIDRGRDRETDSYQPGQATITLLDTDRRFDPHHTPRSGWINFLGNADTFDSTPDHASLDITGDLSILVQFRNLQTSGAIRTVVNKWTTSNASYGLQLTTANKLQFLWTADGSTLKSAISTEALPLGDDRLTVLMVHDVDNNAGGNDVIFVYSDDDGVTSHVLGAPVITSGTTSHFAGTSTLVVGKLGTGGQPMSNGGITGLEIHDGPWPNSTIVAQRSYILEAEQATPFVDTTGKTWTITGTNFTFANNGGTPYATGLRPLQSVRVTLDSANVENYVGLNTGSLGISIDFVTSPDSAQLSVTGNIDVRWFGTLTDWDNGNQTLMSKFGTSGDQRSWMMRCEAAGVRFRMSTDGTAGTEVASTAVPVPFDDGVNGGIRFTRVKTSGLTTVYFSDDDGVTWTASATTTVLAADSLIFDSTAQAAIGASADGLVGAVGRCLRAELWNGIEGSGGTRAASPKFSNLLAGRNLVSSPLTDAEGNVWTGKGAGFDTQIFAGSHLFNGFIADWQLDYEQSDTLGNVTVPCYDALGVLANMELAAITAAHSGDKSGARVDRVLALAEVDYEHPAIVDDGLSTFGATTFGANALSYLQECAEAEAGYMFVGRDGTFNFLDRHTTLNVVAGVTVVDAHSGAGIPYLRATQLSTADLLYNRVTGSSASTSVEQAVGDTASQGKFDIRTLPVGEVFNSTDAQVKDLLTYLLQRFKDPESRFAEIEINTMKRSAADAQLVALLDLTDVIAVKRKPLNIGAIATVNSIVDGVHHRITPGSWTTTLRLSNADTRPFLILNDAVFGALDANRIAF